MLYVKKSLNQSLFKLKGETPRSYNSLITIPLFCIGLNDPNGKTVDEIVPVLLNAAEKEGLKLAFHIEPYKGRGPLSLRQNLSYIHESYGDHPAFYKVNGKPMYYIYDSYMTPSTEWARLLKPGKDW